MTMLPLIEWGEMLTIDPKTLRHWVQQAHLSLSPHPGDARVKCLTMEQVQHLAALHGRALKLHETLATTSVVDPSAPRAPQVPLHPEPARRGVPELSSPVQPDADLNRKLSHLEMTVAALQQQLAQLADANTTSADLRNAAVWAIAAIHTKESLPFLASLVSSSDPYEQGRGITGLSSFANGCPSETPDSASALPLRSTHPCAPSL